MKLNLKETYNKELPSDPILENSRRQVKEACYSFVTPKKTSNPKIIHVSPEVSELLGIEKDELKTKEFVTIFTGNKIIEGTKPYAMCYGGHQFGNWAGQLGDGRAINLTEVEHKGQHWAIQLKGAGETPYSRTADGLAVLRSSIREYLCSEAMSHLGVPTTRALSLALSGDRVLRDVLYNGNPAYEKGAIVTRVAPSFLRFGNYEIFSSRNDTINLKILVDYTLKNFYPHLGAPSKKTYLIFFKQVALKTLDMIIHWQRVGFVHGVMNTDNFSILGLTIDYGPYGWLEGYDFNWTPNTTDSQHKRYRFGNQANIGLWNLLQLANALYPLIEETAPLEKILEDYKTDFEIKYAEMMHSKLGIYRKTLDRNIITDLEHTLHLSETDMTIFFRNLNLISKKDTPIDALKKVNIAFYTPAEIKEKIEEKWISWFSKYLESLNKESYSDIERAKKMNTINPKYVLRNYMSQMAIDATNEGDYTLINELFEILKTPYKEQQKHEKWFAKRPDWARNKAGCSMLSCSS